MKLHTILIILILVFFGAIHQSAQAENNAGQKVLTTAQKMMSDKIIIKGSCWDFLNAAYNNAGYPTNKRTTVFKGTYKNGPYADINTIEPGDWLYYVNYSYNNIEHSGMFVEWEDKKNKQAKILSYAGEHRNEPARYKTYDLTSVYNIIRPEESPTSNLKTEIHTPKIIKGEACDKELILSQNLKAPTSGYVRNGKYHWYTKSTVREADILQKHLNRLGFNAGPVDGIIGPLTRGGILRLQEYLGTNKDGYVGPITRELLNNSC